MVATETIKTIKMPISKLIKNQTCEIVLTGTKTWRVRLWLGAYFFKFAAWFTGMEGVVKIGDQVFGEIKK